MHRTQILLEQWQYEALRARAEREGRSLSALIREFVGKALSPTDTELGRGLDRLEGIGEDTAVYGKDHDRLLYGGEKRLR